MKIFSVSFQFQRMVHEGNRRREQKTAFAHPLEPWSCHCVSAPTVPGGLHDFTRKPSLFSHHWVMISPILVGPPATFTVLPHWASQVYWASEAFTLLSHWTSHVDWILTNCQKPVLSNNINLAKSTGLLRPCLKKESLTPLCFSIPFFGSYGSDIN